MLPTQDVPIVIPETCEYVTIQGKRDFAAVIKLRIFIWRNYFGYSGWAQSNHKGPYKEGRQEDQSQREGLKAIMKLSLKMDELVPWAKE